MSDETTDCSWASSPEEYVRKLAHSWREFGGGEEAVVGGEPVGAEQLNDRR